MSSYYRSGTKRWYERTICRLSLSRLARRPPLGYPVPGKEGALGSVRQSRQLARKLAESANPSERKSRRQKRDAEGKRAISCVSYALQVSSGVYFACKGSGVRVPPSPPIKMPYFTCNSALLHRRNCRAIRGIYNPCKGSSFGARGEAGSLCKDFGWFCFELIRRVTTVVRIAEPLARTDRQIAAFTKPHTYRWLSILVRRHRTNELHKILDSRIREGAIRFNA